MSSAQRLGGRILFWSGLVWSFFMGAVVSSNLGTVCQMQHFPDAAYSLSCFIAWAFGVPLGMVVSSIGILLSSGAKRKQVLLFIGGTLGSFIIIQVINGPIPHVPILFGIGGTLLMVFYFLILWLYRHRWGDHTWRLAGYALLMVGFWFTCGLASGQYHPEIASEESPINIMLFFVLAMFFFWLGERKALR